MRLSEKYRPRRFDEVIGQDKIIKTLTHIDLTYGFGGRAFYLTGNSGQGKTTIARIIARMIVNCRPSDEKFCIAEVVARDLTVNNLRQITHQWAYVPQWGDGYALIVNESHGLVRPVIEYLLDVLETLPDNVIVIFTTTRKGADLFDDQIDAGPFASRCVCLNLTPRGLAELFARRIREIARLENMDGKPESAYLELVKQSGNNFRTALQAVENGAMLTGDGHNG